MSESQRKRSGDERQKETSDRYRENWERIFNRRRGKTMTPKEKNEEAAEEQSEKQKKRNYPIYVSDVDDGDF